MLCAARDYKVFSIQISTEPRVAAIAKQRGWLNMSGRTSGQPNIQHGVSVILGAGLDGIENGQIEAGQLRQIVETWQKECAGRESSPRFEKVAKLLAEISALLPPVAMP